MSKKRSLMIFFNRDRACVLGALMVLIAAMMPGVDAGGCACAGGCSIGNWELSASTFLDSDVPVYNNADNSTAAGVESGNKQSVSKPKDRSDLFANGQILKPLGKLAESDVVIDASQSDGYSQSHINGAIHVPSKSLIDDSGALKPDQELAEILGEAGVSREDSIIVYNEDLSSGDATFLFWTLKYLGQDDVKVLDGSFEDWNAANLPVESSQNKRPAVSYNPRPGSDLLASYDSVNNTEVQIVDARTFAEFGKGSIPGATSLDPAVILQDGKIKDESRLSGIFSRLSKDKPVVVYSDGYNQASIVWYALQLLGYNAKMYTWSDWTAHQPASENGKDAGRYKKLG